MTYPIRRAREDLLGGEGSPSIWSSSVGDAIAFGRLPALTVENLPGMVQRLVLLPFTDHVGPVPLGGVGIELYYGAEPVRVRLYQAQAIFAGGF